MVREWRFVMWRSCWVGNIVSFGRLGNTVAYSWEEQCEEGMSGSVVS